MIDSRVILLEGLPGTGKSTNSGFLRMQLERYGFPTAWFHEVARPHPLQLFNEACLTHEEYRSLLRTHPEARDILNQTAVFYEHTVGIDLLEMEWNYRDAMGEEAFQAIRRYDSWSRDMDSSGQYLLDKWGIFAERAALDRDCVHILDSSLFQFPIFGYLLDNQPYEALEENVLRYLELLGPFRPALIYLHRENVEDSIAFLERSRGVRCLETIWERDRNAPYYRDKPQGAEGFRQFLRDYASLAGRLFDRVGCVKTAVDLTGENWIRCEGQMLSFLDIPRKPLLDATPPPGTYHNGPLDLTLTVDGLVLRDPMGKERKLFPKSQREFYVECLPTVLRVDGSNRLVVAAGQIAERWTTLGTAYRPVGPA